MKPNKLFSPLILASVLAFCSSSVQAQTGEYHNTTETINGSYASGFANFEIGPNADITVNGDWYITATAVKISPTAKIGGTGTMHIMTPKTYGGAAALTTLTAGGALNGGAGITCKVSLENGAGVVLAGTENLVMGNNLAFAKVGSHLTLGATAGLAFTAAAAAIPTITNAPAAPAFTGQDVNNTTFADAYVVTNGAGSVSKAGVAATSGSFSFPVGTSRNSGATTDYTPATVTNTAAATRTLSARVQDYTSSTPVEGNVTTGVNRTWQIQGSAAGTATVALTHNAGTEGSAYMRNAAFITQNTTAGGWSVGMPMAATTPNYTNTGTFDVPAATDGSYFSKSSDAINSLNPFIAASPKVFLQGAYNGTGMTNALTTANLVPKNQPYTFAPFNYAGTEVVTTVPATTTDWVIVELRSAATPATVIATRAGFVLNNGNVTDVDGVSPISFRNTAPGNYFVSVKHRNHLPVRSASALTFTQDAATPYDFTTAQAQAYQNPAVTNNAAQVSVSNGNFAMWGGNANSNTAVNYGAVGSDRFYMLTTARNTTIPQSGLGNNQITPLSNVYSNSDVTMNGTVNYGAVGSDRFFLLVNVLGNQATATRNQHL